VFAAAAMFVLETLFDLLTGAFLLRCILQLARAPFQNPLSQLIVAVTNFAVRPVRRVVPAIGRLDTASLLLALLTQLLLQSILLWLGGVAFSTAQAYAALFGLAALELVKITLYILLYAVIFHALLSWINPHTPFAPVLDSLTRPVLRPLRRVIPPLGGVDLSPLVACIFIEVIILFFITAFAAQLLHLF
jgi:YggT family protein